MDGIELMLEDSVTKDFHKDGKSKLVHWTLGGPWFKDQRNKGGNFQQNGFVPGMKR